MPAAGGDRELWRVLFVAGVFFLPFHFFNGAGKGVLF